MRVHHYLLINYLTNDKGYFVAKRLKQEFDIFGIQYYSEIKEDATFFGWNSQN